MGQSGSSLSATAGKHLAAISGGHSLAEAVLLGALTLLGLIGTEHCMTPPFNKIGVQSVADRLCRTYSTAQKTFCHRSTLFGAAQTAQLVLYIMDRVLSTKIYEIFTMDLFKKSAVFSPETLLNMVVSFLDLSQYMVWKTYTFFLLYIRICVDFSTCFWYNKLIDFAFTSAAICADKRY